MKYRRASTVTVAIAWAMATFLSGAPVWEVEASTAADEAWRQAQAASASGLGDTRGKSSQEIAALREARAERIRRAYLSFYENHPDDVRRWDAVLVLLQPGPRFVSWTADGEAVRDAVAAEAWAATQKELEAAMAAALPGLPARLQERFEARPIFEEIGGLFARLERSEAVDWAALRARVDAHLAKFPDEPAIAGVVSRYMGMFERAHTAQETLAEWRALTVNPVVRGSQMIAKRLEVMERELGRPMQMAFTAADGREVDLEKLRGKVVFIDFWATWCVPCIEELPNVKRVHEAYHDQGFEVIGIALENASLRPDDTPEQTAAKHARARGKLLDFAREHDLPWPQHYDGRYWENEIARGRFNVHSVPSTFLLDKSGVVASVNVRGPQLETEVRRLLGLAPADARSHRERMDSMLEAVKRNDGEAIARTLRTMPVTSRNATGLGSYFGGTFHHYVFNAAGAQACLDIIDRIEPQLPGPPFADEETRKSNGWARRQLAATRALYLSELGRQQEAVAVLDHALETLDDDVFRKDGLRGDRQRYLLHGAAAPALNVDRTHGEFAGLDDYRGRVVLLEFTAHWCHACHKAIPALVRLRQELGGEGLEVLAVTTYYGHFRGEPKSRDMPPAEEYARMPALLQEQGVTWPMIYTDRATLNAYGVTGIPQMTVIDKRGRIRKIDLGYSEAKMARLRAVIVDLLQEQPAVAAVN
jgi:thiol-disulfide isomerase/thioredoxin